MIEYVGSIYEFKSWITGVCSPDVILHVMWWGKSLQLLYILSCGILCLSSIRMVFVKVRLEGFMLLGIVV